MGSINRVVIMGLIGNQPELKFARSGKPFVRLSLSTHRRFKDVNGEMKRDTQWHQVMFWGKIAETCSTYCEKGTAIYVEGHLAHYKKEESGAVSYHTTIVADQMQFIPGSRSAQSVENRDFDQIATTGVAIDTYTTAGAVDENPEPRLN